MMKPGFAFKLLLLSFLPLSAAYALKPDRVYQVTPDSVGAAYQASAVPTADGYKLQTWTYSPNKAHDQHTTIVLAYGDSGNMSYYVEQANALANAGFQVVTFDYRGFGHSSDFPLDTRYLYYQEFVEDLRTVVRYSHRQAPTQKIGIWALSMGTIMGTQVAAGAETDFLLAEGLVTDPLALVSHIKQRRGKQVLVPPQAAAYQQQLAKVSCPVLIFGGTKDTNTPLADARALLRGRVAKPRRWQLIEFDGGHLEGFAVLSRSPAGPDYGSRYIADISTFLHKP